MEQNQPELSFEESIKQVLQVLPPVIRAYVTQEKYAPVARSMTATYGLSVDQGAVLEREIMLLLMGIETPGEFTQALTTDAELDAQTVRSIVRDVNDQIFIPLRTEEEKSGWNAGSMSAPASQQPQVAAPAPIAAAARPGMPAAPHIAPLPPKTVMPNRLGGMLVESPRAGAPMAESINLLQNFKGSGSVVSAAPQPAAVQLPGTIPPYVIPVESRAMPEMRAGSAPAQPAYAAPAQMKPASSAPVSTPITAYTSDPYREPVDEPLSEM